MLILLIQPTQKPEVGHHKIHGSIMPPIGLMQLASVIREKLKHIGVDLMDFEANNGRGNPDYLKYDIVGISGTTVHMLHVYSLVKGARSVNPLALIILGGAHATFCDKQYLTEFPELDAVCRAEGEITK